MKSADFCDGQALAENSLRISNIYAVNQVIVDDYTNERASWEGDVYPKKIQLYFYLSQQLLYNHRV